MIRVLPALLLVFAIAPPLEAASPAPPDARIAPQAYAPERLDRLPTADRIRVIEREYREQSGGHEIPDDQLAFYLDQIEHSRWTFSQVRQDIAESLRGQDRRGPGWRPNRPGWEAQSLICTSDKRRYRECPTPFRGRAELVEQISDTQCVEDRNWGWRPGMVWVDKGCRARFAESRRRPPPAEDVVCESIKGRYQECRTDFRGPAELRENLSSTRCVEDSNWGWRPGMVWVDKGCRARFGEGRRQPGRDPWPPSDYSVSCSSLDGRRASCAWDSRQGPPQLAEQLSKAACVEGQSWGYDGRALWVDRGCRALFAPRRR